MSGAFEALRGLQGESVTYTSGSKSVMLTARPGRTQIETVDDAGAMVVGYTHDWMVSASELTATPEPGDRLTWTTSGTTYTYEVSPLTDGRCWRWSGPPGVEYRIHTKMTGKS